MARLSPRRAAILAAASGSGSECVACHAACRADAADPLVTSIVAFMPLACCGAWRFRSTRKGLKISSRISLSCAAAALLIAALSRTPNRSLCLPDLGRSAWRSSAAIGWRRRRAGAGSWLRREIGRPAFGLIAFLAPIASIYVTVSRDLMFGDFMYRRVEAIIVASFLDKGQFAALVRLFVNSMKDEYSLLPVLAPGAVLATTSPSSRAWYQGAVIVLYAAPADPSHSAFSRGIWRYAQRDDARRPSANLPFSRWRSSPHSPPIQRE